MSQSREGQDLIRNTQAGRRDAENIASTPPSSGAGTDTGITGDDGPGGGITGPGAGLPDPVTGDDGPNRGTGYSDDA